MKLKKYALDIFNGLEYEFFLKKKRLEQKKPHIHLNLITRTHFEWRMEFSICNFRNVFKSNNGYFDIFLCKLQQVYDEKKKRIPQIKTNVGVCAYVSRSHWLIRSPLNVIRRISMTLASHFTNHILGLIGCQCIFNVNSVFNLSTDEMLMTDKQYG